ncbi:purine-nucleoside phosphorylase [Effusibacillus lacus]|uniref:Purine nucleoside phosphorylase n=1 Tax=Effusibacillus lacus TaxID=1348429 RepID=A0A292YEQ2_9BACL|nr:purine-nucleoside phosphorylase [Effusibacillus lacus]TCS76317.1 purine-nucleoside phosphorylase [Effusibacillus lacus]GAX91862.1 purine-nucleoside phosphorylase [Effusibacillus lacus]
MTFVQKIEETVTYIRSKSNLTPRVGLILGSGLGVLADEIENATIIDFGDIPNFPVSTVEGHAGKLVIGMLEGCPVVAMQGRFHFYEGYTQKELTFPVYGMKFLGCDTLIVTNACGGMNRNFQPGDLMLIADHINFTGSNPLIGANDPKLGPRFPDMSQAYNRELIAIAERTAVKIGIKVQKGVYAAISGPAYCTPSELIMLRNLGADAVGMSTVPEVIAANHTGLKVLGISCVTDMAIGEELEPLTHEQVVEVANRTRPKFITLVKGFLSEVR